jgi:uncharacterized membrane protein (UPF0127 family)
MAVRLSVGSAAQRTKREERGGFPFATRFTHDRCAGTLALKDGTRTFKDGTRALNCGFAACNGAACEDERKEARLAHDDGIRFRLATTPRKRLIGLLFERGQKERRAQSGYDGPDVPHHSDQDSRAPRSRRETLDNCNSLGKQPCCFNSEAHAENKGHDAQVGGNRSRGEGTQANGYSRDEALLLVPCRAVHTFGMKQALDIAFIDSFGKVTKSLRDVGPRRSLQDRRACAVLERFSCPLPWFQEGDHLVLQVSAMGASKVGEQNEDR